MTDFLIVVGFIAGYGVIGGVTFGVVQWLGTIIFTKTREREHSFYAGSDLGRQVEKYTETYLAVDAENLLALCWASACLWPVMLPGFVGYALIAKKGKQVASS